MAHTHIEHIHEGTTDSGMGFLMGIILLMLFIFMLFYYGLPVIRNTVAPQQAAPQINVPDKVDVNIKQSK